ncbi:PucR family transcriptional regulator [Sporolactobacillus terrae]|uniref:Transcriptional regulator n=1 Tax=Sporolactobacillus terrae TaxID=269673 RepID=A0A5K7WUE3_9BACL|nr:PucR family transcriptional regulator [Sporolactobacillus terrae]BBN97947.1 transcriptional regulator [Sporolactobacillus terrae]
MYYSVDQVLAQPLMGKAKVLSGMRLLKQCPVESVSVIEQPVEKFVKKNELVLTTGIGFDRAPETFESFVQEIYASHASALAVATGRHIKTVPHQVIAFAQNKGFPLIQLPWEIRFSDVIKNVLSGINHWEEFMMHQYKKLQREMINAYLEGKSIHEALLVMEHFSQAHIYILQRRNETIFSTAPERHPHHPSLHINQLILDKPSVMNTAWGSRAQIYPFEILNQSKAALVIDSDSSQLPIIPPSILEQAIIALQLWFKKQQLAIHQSNTEKERLIATMISKDWKNGPSFVARAERQKFSPTENYCCIVGKPEQSGHKQTAQDTNDLAELATKTAQEICESSLCAFHSKYLVIFLRASGDSQEITEGFLERFEEKRNGYHFPIFSWGISDRPANIHELSTSYKNACIALETGRSRHGIGTRSTFTDTCEFQILSHLSKNRAAKDIVQKIIGPLVAYNSERGLDLMHTLTYYIHHNGNVSQTARALSLQRQSLIYRLQKIEGLTGKSLSKSDDLFLLQLCVKLWTMTV